MSLTGTLFGIIVGRWTTLNTNKESIKNQNENLKKTIENQNENLKTTIKNEISENQKSLSIQYITNKRVDWIYVVRDTISEFISLAYFIAEKYKLKSLKVDSALYRNLNKETAKLKLFFNFTGDIDKDILGLINNIVNNLGADKFDSNEFQNDINLLTKHSQIYLKLEWERVKLETKNEFSSEKLNEKKEELYKKYDETYKQNIHRDINNNTN